MPPCPRGGGEEDICFLFRLEGKKMLRAKFVKSKINGVTIEFFLYKRKQKHKLVNSREFDSREWATRIISRPRGSGVGLLWKQSFGKL
ncbi:hypothetical protein OPV22_014723 [Ensete ventricosum]|uniref:Uncharacterized protein n=1 Tax=Ensete ventricosum TaxID=4639 RepID=A0AAV8RC24_ENSVE|nr:hypothetical protein OPV22_014723 [Ensete ventricosum]